MKKNYQLFASTSILAFTAFANPGWKIGADGKIELKDGNPIYVHADGTEGVIEAKTVGDLNAEAKRNRERYETAENDLKKFEGITDPVKAKEALELAKKIDQKKLLEIGEVDKLTDQIKAQFTEQVTELNKKLGETTSKLHNNQIAGIFAQSDFVRNNVAVPLDMFEATFRSNFKVEENGEIGAYGRDGNRINSKKNLGRFADPDEALQLLVEAHPSKDKIIAAPKNGGSGNNGNGGGRGTGRYVSRADFEKMSPAEQGSIATQAGKGELTITD